MELSLLVFARLRELAGADSVPVVLSEGATVAEALDALCAAYPAALPMRSGLKVAVNHQLARAGRVLAVGDEVAILPPVGGG